MVQFQLARLPVHALDFLDFQVPRLVAMAAQLAQTERTVQIPSLGTGVPPANRRQFPLCALPTPIWPARSIGMQQLQPIKFVGIPLRL